MGRKVTVDNQGNEHIVELNSRMTNAQTNQSVNVVKSASQNSNNKNNKK